MVEIKADWAYLKLRAVPECADELTWRLITSTALSRFAGIAGQAIELDLLKFDHQTCIVRCPAENLEVVRAALSVELDNTVLYVDQTSSFLVGLS